MRIIDNIQEIQRILSDPGFYKQFNKEELERIEKEIHKEKELIAKMAEEDYLTLFRSSSNVSEIHSRSVNKNPLFDILRKGEMSRFSRLIYLQRQFDNISDEIFKIDLLCQCIGSLEKEDREIIDVFFSEESGVDEKMEKLNLQKTQYYRRKDTALRTLMKLYNRKAKIETLAKEDSVQKMFEEFAIFWNELSDFKAAVSG